MRGTVGGISKNQLEYMYLKLGMSAVDIKEVFNCCITTIYYWLRKHEIPIRNCEESHNMPLSTAKVSRLFTGSHHTEEWKQTQSLYMKGDKGRTGKHNTVEHNIALKQATLKRFANPLERNKAKEISKKIWKDPKHRKKMANSMTKVYSNPEVRAKMSESARQRWDNYTPEERTARIQTSFKVCRQKPTNPESQLSSLLNSAFPDKWKYVGDWEVIIGGKCPDFININGKKQIIELFGNFWHSKEKTGRTEEEEVKLRKEIFTKYGYDTLIIWQNELKNQDNILAKVSEFTLAHSQDFKSIR